jgi:hypothetical protein
MSWDEGQTMQARFEHARQTCLELHAHWKLGDSYGGFTAALARHSLQLAPAIVRRFQRQMRKMAGKHWLCHGHQAFAVDGTRIEAPHTEANDQGLGCAGREKSAPQVFLTTMRHMGLGLPWDFRLGPGTDSERRHLEEMLPSLPKKSMIVADAGFCGYELCQRTVRAGHSFVLRVGGNVTLLTELGFHFQERDGLVYLWPTKLRDQPPLALRLIKLVHKQQTIFLLTNLLDEEELSTKDAASIYKSRWEIEVFYRSYKQTLDRHTLLSRTPENCLLETTWVLLALWLLGIMTVIRQLAHGNDPHQWSPAGARNAVRQAMRRAHHVPRAGGSLDIQWLGCVQDVYQRKGPKAARNYPRKKREKPPGPPQIKPATAAQIRLAQELKTKQLTAA